MTITELQSRFSIPGVVRFEAGRGELIRVVITTPQAQAHVYLHGAHVTHYQPAGQAPALFMSGKSWFEASKPIRGGVPICFPWFGPRAGDPASPAHGFARLRQWTLESARQNSDGSVTVVLKLVTDDATRAIWPHDFELRHIVTVGATLQMELELRNTSAGPFTFEEALHTYLAVSDIHQVSVEGLTGVTYIDKTQAMQRKVQGDEPITFAGELDRTHINTRSTCVAHDPAGRRDLIVAKEGSQTTVVWNPWIAKAKAMADFGDEEWPGMLCIETANAADNAVNLQSGQTHRMRAIVSAKAR